jgi:hypothetical protein
MCDSASRLLPSGERRHERYQLACEREYDASKRADADLAADSCRYVSSGSAAVRREDVDATSRSFAETNGDADAASDVD